MKYCLVVAVICLFAMAGGYGQEIILSGSAISTNGKVAKAMTESLALRLLGSAGQRQESDATAARRWAYLLLEMPCHASQNAGDSQKLFRSQEQTLMDVTAARVIEHEAKEEVRFETMYLPIAGSSNALFGRHLSNLRDVPGCVALTNLGKGNSIDITPLQKDVKGTIALIMLSKDQLSEDCATGHVERLIDELRLATKMGRQGCWDLIIAICQLDPNTVMTIKIIPIESSDNRSSAEIKVSTSSLFGANQPERETKCEDLILDALHATSQ